MKVELTSIVSTNSRLHKPLFTGETWFLILAQFAKLLRMLGELFYPGRREILQLLFSVWNLIHTSKNYKIWRLNIVHQGYEMWMNSHRDQIYKRKENHLN